MPTLGISGTTKEKGVGWEERTDQILQIRHKVRVASWTTSLFLIFMMQQIAGGINIYMTPR